MATVRVAAHSLSYGDATSYVACGSAWWSAWSAWRLLSCSQLQELMSTLLLSLVVQPDAVATYGELLFYARAAQLLR